MFLAGLGGHLQPGSSAALLSHEQTLALYRANATKARVHDADLIYELAVLMVETATATATATAAVRPPPWPGAAAGSTSEKQALLQDALPLLRRIADRGHAEAQYFLADCYVAGLTDVAAAAPLAAAAAAAAAASTSWSFQPLARPQWEKAYPLFVQASKHGHADAAYRAAECLEHGRGVLPSNGKAQRLYRKAAAAGHAGAMLRLGTAELNGELGLARSAKGGVKWIKLAAAADADEAGAQLPEAVHELAMLHQRGIDSVVFADCAYACKLLTRAAVLGYAPSAHAMGTNYEYGRMGCAPNAGLSIHMYNIAAQQGHPESCLALCAWYLVGVPGILPQSDTEAYLWAKRAAEQRLAKAQYPAGYFTEFGIGTTRDLPAAKTWYLDALKHGDERASVRLQNLGKVFPEPNSAATPRKGKARAIHVVQSPTDGKTYTVHTAKSYRNSTGGPLKGWFRGRG